MKKILVTFFLGCLINSIFSQKAVHIPQYLLDTNTVDGHQFSWSKTHQSTNFIIIWGDSAGLNPMLSPDPTLVFNPVTILDTMESIYQVFKNVGFAHDTIGTNLYAYKIPIIMYNTFGPSGATGWANGGDADGIIGAFWVHPMGMQSGHVAAHELAHSLQMQCLLDYRIPNSLGGAWNNMGIFWETHANFMRNIIYPQDVSTWGMDLFGMEAWGQWKNTYENYHLLFAIKEEDGIGIINNMWENSFSNEYPIESYKRLSSLSQQDLNHKLFKYVRRMATLDFPSNNLGTYLSANRSYNMLNFIPTVQTMYTILKRDTVELTHFIASDEIAPEEYGYNIIPLNPIIDSCAVIIKFKGHTNANSYAGWRYGFVTSLPDGKISRYSDIYSAADTTIGFSLLPTESQMYLVVMGAPDTITTDTNHDTWTGYPKHFRFPYELTITGGTPEGYQTPENFRSHLKTNGHIHSNGGGWVSNTSTVSSTVFVAPHAMVMGNSNISGNVQIRNTAMVMDATISDNVKVLENAFVLGGHLSNNVKIAGLAFVENDSIYDNALIDMRGRVSNYKLHGNVHVGGDVLVYNMNGDCDNGVYYRMTNYYQDNLLECDNRTDSHPNNTDVNTIYAGFSNEEMNMQCNCINYPNCFQLGIKDGLLKENEIIVYPNPTNNVLHINFQNNGKNNYKMKIFNFLGMEIYNSIGNLEQISIDVADFSNGIYLLEIISEKSTTIKKFNVNK